MKYTEAILWNSHRKLLWFEIAKMLIALLENKFDVLFIIIFGTLSFRIYTAPKSKINQGVMGVYTRDSLGGAYERFARG